VFFGKNTTFEINNQYLNIMKIYQGREKFLVFVPGDIDKYSYTNVIDGCRAHVNTLYKTATSRFLHQWYDEYG
jgi:hypothetical protein